MSSRDADEPGSLSITEGQILDAASQVSIIATDAAGLITVFNAGAQRLLGYRREEVLGTSPIAFHLPEEVAKQGQLLSREAGQPVTGFETFVYRARKGMHDEREWTYLTKDGSRRTIQLTVTAIRDDGATITGFLGIAIDITERKNAEQRLRQTSHELRAAQRLTQMAMDNIPQFIFWKDVDSVYQGCNQNFANAAGLASPADVVGKSDFDLAWKHEEAEFFRSVDRRVMGSKTAEYHIIEPQLQADGKQAWLDTNKVPMLDDEGQVIGILGTFEDITERKQVEEDLRRSEEDLRTTLNSIGDAVISTDTDGQIVRMNAVAERLTGWSSAEAVGKPLANAFQAVDALSRKPEESPISRAMTSDRPPAIDRQTMLLSRGGREFRIADSVSPIRSESGDTLGVVLVFRDITEEHRLQDQLRHSQKLDAIGQLAGGVAHDFNNMLAGILGAAEILEGELPDSARAKRLHRVIMDSAQRAASLTGKLLAFARRQPASIGGIDVHGVLGDLTALLENTVDRRITIGLELAATNAHIVGDESQLQSALLNLGINASHAMPRGGELTLRSRNVELDAAFCEASSFELEPGGFIEIEVRDTGRGIAPEDIDRIFEPFFTTKEQGQGTGLGLSAVYGTVKQHGGSVLAVSEPGQGASFRILLPVVAGTAAVEPRPLTPLPGRGCILVVDDEEAMRVTTEAVLVDLGYEVVLAEDGADGLSQFAEAPEKFDLVILDMVMPRMNGRDCFAAMHKLDPEVPVLLASGYVRDQDVQQMQELGLRGFIRKPYSIADLSLAVSDALRESKQAE